MYASDLAKLVFEMTDDSQPFEAEGFKTKLREHLDKEYPTAKKNATRKVQPS